MKKESEKTADETKRMPELRQGAYSDGHPLDEVHYLECKVILKGDRFTSVENFHDFGKIVRHTAEASDVGYSTEEFKGLRPQIREVLFLDTQDFRLYNNAFILRRRLDYVDGFAVGDPKLSSNSVTRTYKRLRRWTFGRGLTQCVTRAARVSACT
jgi:hypothetical protein